jgi:uncharacterized protein (TIGR02186 family)
MRALFALLALLLLTGARDPILVPEVSQHEIQVRQGFTGAELLLFGAILSPDGTRAGQDYDIVVVLKGPTSPAILREKRKIAGIWINAASTELHSVPAYFAVASTRPIARMPWLQLSPTGAIDPKALERFAGGLVDLMMRKGLYQQNEGGVKVSEQVLYQARIALPSSVATGRYTAETFAISKGHVVASAISQVDVRKLGFEGAIAQFAQTYSFLYCLLAVAIAVIMGWLAGRVFALV